MEYDGGRTSSDIVSWATEKLAENLPPPEVVQVRYDTECGNEIWFFKEQDTQLITSYVSLHFGGASTLEWYQHVHVNSLSLTDPIPGHY